MQPMPMRVLMLAHDITRIGKGRHPSPVDQPCVPSDMVGMQMRAEHDVDVLRLQRQSRQFTKIGRIKHMPGWHGLPLLVVSAAGIDQNVVTRGLHHVTVKAQEHDLRRWIDELRPQPATAIGQYFGSDVRHQRRCLHRKAGQFRHLADLDRPELLSFHVLFFLLQANRFMDASQRQKLLPAGKRHR